MRIFLLIFILITINYAQQKSDLFILLRSLREFDEVANFDDIKYFEHVFDKENIDREKPVAISISTLDFLVVLPLKDSNSVKEELEKKYSSSFNSSSYQPKLLDPSLHFPDELQKPYASQDSNLLRIEQISYYLYRSYCFFSNNQQKIGDFNWQNFQLLSRKYLFYVEVSYLYSLFPKAMDNVIENIDDTQLKSVFSVLLKSSQIQISIVEKENLLLCQINIALDEAQLTQLNLSLLNVNLVISGKQQSHKITCKARGENNKVICDIYFPSWQAIIALDQYLKTTTK